jgi:hypothetical protein
MCPQMGKCRTLSALQETLGGRENAIQRSVVTLSSLAAMSTAASRVAVTPTQAT